MDTGACFCLCRRVSVRAFFEYRKMKDIGVYGETRTHDPLELATGDSTHTTNTYADTHVHTHIDTTHAYTHTQTHTHVKPCLIDNTDEIKNDVWFLFIAEFL